MDNNCASVSSISNGLGELSRAAGNCGQTLPKEVEGAIELGVIRPDLLTTHQIQMIAQNLKDRLIVGRGLRQSQQTGANTLVGLSHNQQFQN